MTKIKVLDLFAGTQSVRKALELTGLEFDYIGIDIYSPEEKNTILDLTQDDIVNKLIEVLPIGWKPDFIWASPVCEKISLATAMFGGHNAYFELDKETKTIKPWPIGTQTRGAKNYQSIQGTEKALKAACWTLDMFRNTQEIINYFKVPFAIENPRHSLTRYVLKDYVRNDTSYCMYGFPQQKHTNIYTNKELNLKVCNHIRGSHSVGVYGKAKHKKKELVAEYKDRAAVPPLLIVDIFNQLFNKEQNNENK